MTFREFLNQKDHPLLTPSLGGAFQVVKDYNKDMLTLPDPTATPKKINLKPSTPSIMPLAGRSFSDRLEHLPRKPTDFLQRKPRPTPINVIR